MREGAVEDAEMKWIWVPIVDGDVPTQANDDGLSEVLNSLLSGESVFVHCKGGLGRAGTVSAWLLTHYGRTAQEAISEVRGVRKRALENQRQENWVSAHASMFLGSE
jgi:ADP-ribosyl-[dinitrogen reductase] hydrolase